MILTGGRIYTLDPAVPTLAALAVTRDGRVARGVEAWEGDTSMVSNERIDLGGRTVLPGFVDAHVHFRLWALEQSTLDLSGCTSARECAELAAGVAGAGWVLGRGWRVGGWSSPEAPTAAQLDARLGDRPAALWAHDHHSLWLSSRALATLGVTRDTPAPARGVIDRDALGEPTGIVREEAAWRLPLPEPLPAQALAAVDAGQARAHAAGVTQIHDMEAHGGFAIWQELHADRMQTLRVLASQRADHLDAVRRCELRTGFGDAMLQIGPVKAFLDGTLGSRTARMLEPFTDGGTGVAITEPSEFVAIVRAASDAGLAVAVHAIGDRANRDALDAFEATRSHWQPRALRPRIEHAQLLHEDDLPRFAALGVTASMQPTHATTDADTAEVAWGERCSGAYAWRALADSGALLAFGSDAPIEPLSPLDGIHAAVNRTLDRRSGWRTEQALTVGEAIAGFTSGAADAAGWGHRLGRLKPGHEADLVVLDADPFACPPDRLRTIGVVATMVAGRWVHGRPPW